MRIHIVVHWNISISSWVFLEFAVHTQPHEHTQIGLGWQKEL